jgi:hypothetical protein
MKTLKLLNHAADSWVAGDGSLAPVHSAVIVGLHETMVHGRMSQRGARGLASGRHDPPSPLIS